MEVDAESAGRLVLAVVCIGILIAARWRHEQRVASTPRVMRMPALEGSAGRGLRAPRLNRRGLQGGLSQSLYWLGLTTSAALAAQALAAIIIRSRS